MVAGEPELDALLQELTNVSLRIGAFAERSGWLDAIDDFEDMLDDGDER